jgi:hypothetical protein
VEETKELVAGHKDSRSDHRSAKLNVLDDAVGLKPIS